MIVRDEAHILERCLDSARPLLDAVVVCDTGSRDGTEELARGWIARECLPGRVVSHDWRDFGHNRTLAIAEAQGLLRELGSDLERSYLLFLDADMMLEIGEGFRREALDADVYEVQQRAGGLLYPNVRLVRAGLDGRFVGATHEHWSGPPGTRYERLATLTIDDRNDGGSKADKFERDVRLLEEELRRDPSNVRAMFYLAQSYRALGDHGKALLWYRRRIAAGGWIEEVWYAQYAIGLMHASVGETAAAVRAFHAAIRLDPTRAEPYFHLALHLRNSHRQRLAAAYARRGLELPLPGDRVLFLERDVYEHGLLRELSIAAFYTGGREEGFAACEALALGEGMPLGLSQLGASNEAFYAAPLALTAQHPLRPILPPPFAPDNPAILPIADGYLINVRGVSYRVDDYQRFCAMEPDGIMRTRNVVMEVGRDLSFVRQGEIVCDVPPLRPSPVQGLEDLRLVTWEGRVAFTCTTHDLHPQGFCRMSFVVLDEDRRVERHVPLSGYGDDRYQKNWLPWVDPASGELYAIYGFEPFVLLRIDPESGRCTPAIERTTGRNLQGWRGSAGPVALPAEAGGGRLLLVHEVHYHGLRYYFHRFVLLDDEWRLRRVSRPFYFFQRGIEYVCGLCLSHDGNEVLLGVSMQEREAWLCRLPLERVLASLRPVDEIAAQAGATRLAWKGENAAPR